MNRFSSLLCGLILTIVANILNMNSL